MISFEKKSLSDKQLNTINVFTKRFTEVAKMIDDCCYDGRLKSIALTKLEESAMFAIKSISHDGVIDIKNNGSTVDKIRFNDLETSDFVSHDVKSQAVICYLNDVEDNVRSICGDLIKCSNLADKLKYRISYVIDEIIREILSDD